MLQMCRWCSLIRWRVARHISSAHFQTMMSSFLEAIKELLLWSIRARWTLQPILSNHTYIVSVVRHPMKYGMLSLAIKMVCIVQDPHRNTDSVQQLIRMRLVQLKKQHRDEGMKKLAIKTIRRQVRSTKTILVVRGLAMLAWQLEEYWYTTRSRHSPNIKSWVVARKARLVLLLSHEASRFKTTNQANWRCQHRFQISWLSKRWTRKTELKVQCENLNTAKMRKTMTKSMLYRRFHMVDFKRSRSLILHKMIQKWEMVPCLISISVHHMKTCLHSKLTSVSNH